MRTITLSKEDCQLSGLQDVGSLGSLDFGEIMKFTSGEFRSVVEGLTEEGLKLEAI